MIPRVVEDYGVDVNNNIVMAVTIQTDYATLVQMVATIRMDGEVFRGSHFSL